MDLLSPTDRPGGATLMELRLATTKTFLLFFFFPELQRCVCVGLLFPLKSQIRDYVKSLEGFSIFRKVVYTRSDVTDMVEAAAVQRLSYGGWGGKGK